MMKEIARKASCYASHPPMPLTGGLVIYGGSCLNPVVTDADLYIGFDRGMKFTGGQYPWTGYDEILVKVADQGVPDHDVLKNLVEWTVTALQSGKKVHAGCIGGHGRTGLFLAALFHAMTGRKDAGQVVRDTYCSKAIESQAQVDFLHKHFGIERIKPRHEKVPVRSSKSWDKCNGEWNNNLMEYGTRDSKTSWDDDGLTYWEGDDPLKKDENDEFSLVLKPDGTETIWGHHYK